jgi:FkbH-like protein
MPALPSDAIRKCIIWDLDNTVWNGVLLDLRGILHSIASRSDPTRALARLAALGVRDYFLAPQVDWDAKSAQVSRIADALRLSPDSFAFIDDDPFERDEVAAAHPGILCLSPEAVGSLAQRPDFSPASVSREARLRRASYRTEQARQTAERDFGGPPSEFLAGLDLSLSIAPASESSLARAEELVLRTHQLNSTGITYSGDEIASMARDRNYRVLLARLTDRYGDYGVVGLAIVELKREAWTIKLLLVSCRVISRGVGAELLRFVVERAQAAGARLAADFIPNDVNRMTFIAFRLAGFRPEPGTMRLVYDGRPVMAPPPHLRLSESFGEIPAGALAPAGA